MRPSGSVPPSKSLLQFHELRSAWRHLAVSPLGGNRVLLATPWVPTLCHRPTHAAHLSSPLWRRLARPISSLVRILGLLTSCRQDTGPARAPRQRYSGWRLLC